MSRCRRAPAVLTALSLALAALPAAASAGAADDYWAARLQGIARIEAMTRAKAGEDKITAVERAAVDRLKNRLVDMLEGVAVEGFDDEANEHVGGLRDNPDFGELDGVYFRFRDNKPGSLLITTQAVLQHWQQDKAKKDPAAQWPRAGAAALKGDAIYSPAFAGGGFESVADLPIKAPAGVSLAVAKFGRNGVSCGTVEQPELVAAVVKDGKVYIAEERPALPIAEAEACHKAAAAIEDTYWTDEAFGPGSGDGRGFAVWRDCERRVLPSSAFYKPLLAEAQQLVDRMARAHAPQIRAVSNP